MRKMLKMIQENVLFFLDMMFLIVTLVATVFIPDLVYGLYAGYVFMILDVYLLVEDKTCRIFQIATLLVCALCVVIGQTQNSAAMMYIMHPLAMVTWMYEFIAYLKIMEMKKK